jgi:transcriptional regulator GlxA family with amidase domain
MRFGFVAFPALEELDLVGPWEMVGMWARAGQGPDEWLLASDTREPVRCANGMVLLPHTTFAECPPLDYLLVPGGEGVRDLAATDAVVRFLAERARECRAVLSVCTGSLLLHRAGLLKGRRATTHWSALEELRSLPDVRVVEERFTEDDGIWTAAGVSAGIDMVLAFISKVAGDTAAGRAQLGAECGGRTTARTAPHSPRGASSSSGASSASAGSGSRGIGAARTSRSPICCRHIA